MATEKQALKDMQRRKAESIKLLMESLSQSFRQGSLRKISEPKSA